MENPFKFGTIVGAEYFTAQAQASPRLRVNAIDPLGARLEEFPPEVRDEALDDSRVLKINGLLKHNI